MPAIRIGLMGSVPGPRRQPALVGYSLTCHCYPTISAQRVSFAPRWRHGERHLPIEPDFEMVESDPAIAPVLKTAEIDRSLTRALVLKRSNGDAQC